MLKKENLSEKLGKKKKMGKKVLSYKVFIIRVIKLGIFFYCLNDIQNYDPYFIIK